MKFTGKVIKGDMRGRKLGFPTVNLDVRHILPERGVYFARTDGLPSLMHHGPLSTHGIESDRVEIHILDFEGDLYGREVTVEVFDKIRDVAKFNSTEELVMRIQEDIALAREFFAV
ncbi:riboflavin kinase [Candidatus Peregrinibacteria bacterium]|nr:riboflavin kinase [Candidatus Peregrinibacteria bacterium]